MNDSFKCSTKEERLTFCLFTFCVLNEIDLRGIRLLETKSVTWKLIYC
jgi:hypothetical protein